MLFQAIQSYASNPLDRLSVEGGCACAEGVQD